MHVAPFAAIGIVLEIEMIDPVFVNHAIGIVHPAIGGCVVVDRPVIVSVGHAPSVSKPHGGERKVALLQSDNLHHGARSLAQGKGHVVVGLALSEAHVHPSVGGVARVKQHLFLIGIFFDRKNQIFSRSVYSHHSGVAIPTDTQLLGRGSGDRQGHSCQQ